jgi:hypothetical protein
MKSAINKMSAFVSIALLLSCADDSLDPFRLKDQTKGSLLALRGDSFDRLNETNCTNSFFRDKITGSEAFVMNVEFLSEDPSVLQEIKSYAHYVRGDEDGNVVLEKREEVATFPASTLTVPSGGGNPVGTLSINLSTILSALEFSTEDAENIQSGELTIESDLVLKDGTVIKSTSIVNSGLFQSGIFYPAQTLTYCAEDIADYIPEADLSLRVDKPLKSGAKDTLDIVFSSEIATPPTVTLDDPIGAISSVIADPGDDTNTKFYVIYTAPGGYTGPVTLTITGAVNGGTGATAGLVQEDQSATIEVDNTPPQHVGDIRKTNLAAPAAGERIGRGQFVQFDITFQEPINPSDTLLFSLSGQGLDDVVEEPMELSEDGKTATYLYIYKDSDNNPSDATHGDLIITISGGKDLAGNAFEGESTELLNDVGTPPEPVVTPAPSYDYGNDIRWTATTAAGSSNPEGATSGTVYFIAVPRNNPAPGQAITEVAGVEVYNGFDTEGVDVVAEGAIPVTNGSSGTIFSSFRPNGDFDVYFYFVNSTGNTSKNTTTPLEITMN